MSQPVRALFLVFKHSPCQGAVKDALRDAHTNGWATQLYEIDSIVTPSLNKHLDDSRVTSYLETSDTSQPARSNCDWLLLRVLHDTIALAEREQAQLFIFCGGYGSTTPGEPESILFGNLCAEPTDPYIDPFLILDEVAKHDRDCLVILHTHISETRLERWHDEHKDESSANVQILLFIEESPKGKIKGKGRPGGPYYSMGVPELKQANEAAKALSSMITSCRFGKLQLNESLLQKLRVLELHFSTFFTSKAPRLTMEACDNAKPIKRPKPEEKYTHVSVLMIGTVGRRIALRYKIMKEIFTKLYGFKVELSVSRKATGQDITPWADDVLDDFLNNHDHEDGLIMAFFADYTSITEGKLVGTTSRQTMDYSTLDTTLKDSSIKSDVLRVRASDHTDPSQERVETDNDDRIVDLVTESLDRLIGRFIHRAGAPFSINDLKQDLQEMQALRSNQDKKLKRRDASIRQGKLIVSQSPDLESSE